MKQFLSFKNIKKSIIALSTIALLTGIIVFPRITSAEGTAVFLSGNTMTAGNRTTRTVDWEDPVNTLPGNLIEFRVVAENTAPGTVANNVKVTASLQNNRASTITASGTISADNASSVTDSATINITNGELQRFDYVPGHVRVFSPSCPSGCDVGDTVLTSGVNVGNLAWGQSAQVLFKAHVTNFTPEVAPTVTPTPTGVQVTPTPTPTGTPGPTVTPTPTGVQATPTPTTPPAQGSSVECPGGFSLLSSTRVGEDLIITCQSQNQSIGPITITLTGGNSSATGGSSSSTSSSTGGSSNVTLAAAAPAAIKGVSTQLDQLPKTGLPLVAWALAGFLPGGVLVRKLGLKGTKSDDSPYYLTQERDFLRES